MEISIRCIEKTDIDDVARLANNDEIAQMTANLPYPYTTTHAATWLDYVENNEQEHVFAICKDSLFLGVVGLVHEKEHRRAELGYWLGQEYWNNGYTSAAAEMAIAYAFSILDIDKIYSNCFATNTPSKKILEKNIFLLEGCLKNHYIRMGKTMDVLCFGLLKEDYDNRRK